MEGPNQTQERQDMGLLDADSRFLFRVFRRYYRSFTPEMPHRFARKEFGFIPFGGTMRRHMAFQSPEDLKFFMATRVPRHSYYSTSYYRYPAKPEMDLKEWLGAELIFDLDADHLAGADDMTYSEMMVEIRREMISLCDDYLYSDLGFTEDQVHICFSGGRGYHAHIRTDDIYTLGTRERREIVDYVSCQGLDLDRIFRVEKASTGTRQYGNSTYGGTQTFRRIPSAEQGGWYAKTRKLMVEAMDDVRSMDLRDLRKKYPSIAKKEKETVAKYAEHIGMLEQTMLERGTMQGLTNFEQEFIMSMLKDAAPRMASEVDKPVTPDIKRLIRLPGSVHGKTGLRVSHLTRDQLTDYDPLKYAVPDAYTDEPVKVTMKKDMELDMLGQHFVLRGETEVPEYCAVFLVGRRYAGWGWASEAGEKLFG